MQDGSPTGPFERAILWVMAARRIALIAVALTVVAVPSAEARDLPGFPENRGSFQYFASPSGRIVCGYASGPRYSIDCTDYSGTERGQNFWKVRPRGRAWKGAIMANAPSQGLPRMRYGVAYHYHGITCRVHRTRGVTCRNRDCHGFTVSVERKSVF